MVVYLIDNSTGILKIIRTLAFNSEFGEILEAIINLQLQDDVFDAEEYAQMINHIYNNLSSEQVFMLYNVHASRPTMCVATDCIILDV